MRYKEVANFVTNPFTEVGQNKNATTSGDDTGTDTDTLNADEIAVMEALKELFPDNCRFANYRIDIKTIAADTSLQRIAPVPVCIIEKNFKEF